MAGTRKSTRQSTALVPTYTELSSDSELPKPNGKKLTRRKRAREDEDGTAEEYVGCNHGPELSRSVTDDFFSPLVLHQKRKR
jgi:hypothetical protein